MNVITSFLAGIMMVWGSIFHPAPKLGANVTALPIVLANYSDSLAAPITSSATSMTLVSGVDTLGRALSGFYCFTVDAQTASSEFICGTATGTSIASLTRGVDPLNPNATSGSLQFSHRRGASVQITDYTTLGYVTRMLSGTDTLPAVLQYPSGTSDAQISANSQNLVNYKTLADAVTGGAVPASTTVSGLSQEATSAQINSATEQGSTGAELFVNPSYLYLSNYGTYLPTANQKAALAGTGTPNGTTGLYVTKDTATSTYQILSNISTDPLMGGAAPSSTLYPSQAADKQYSDLQLVQSTIFDALDRFTTTNVSGGTTILNGGLQLDTSSTTTSSTRAQWLLEQGSSDSIINGNPIFSTGFNMSGIGTSGTVYMGLGIPTVAGTGITYTIRHIGFKVTMTAGPVATLYATQADGTTENASSALTTISTTDDVEVALRVNSNTSVDYFWRKNGGTWSAATNLTSNFPSTAISSQVNFDASNNSTTQDTTITFSSATYKR